MKSLSARSILWLPILILLVMIAAPRIPAGPFQTWLVRASLPELFGCSVFLIFLASLLENPRGNKWIVSGLLDASHGANQAEVSSDEEGQQSSAGERTFSDSHSLEPKGTERVVPGRIGRLGEWGWLSLGLVFLIGCLAFLERMQPFYFSQDDNLVQFLPTILQGCRSFADGIFPTWNPYQFLGAPTASLGVYALTYPPTYFSYWVARSLLHNEYLTCEVFCTLHLGAGYFAGYWACREASLSRGLSATGSLCLALSGFMLLAGRSWYYMTPVLFWSPLLVISTLRLQRGRTGWKWALATGFVIGAFFHAGNAQMWIYAVLFWVLSIAILAACRKSPLRSLRWAAAALALGVGIASPLLVPQALATANLVRPYIFEWTIKGNYGSLLLPFFGGQLRHPQLSGSSENYSSQLFYSGTLFYAASAWAVAALLLFRFKGRLVADNIWLVCGILAFLFTMGPSGGLWSLMGLVPPFNKFEHPIKFLAFLNLFTVIGGGTVLQRYLSHSKRAKCWDALFFLTVCALLAYHCELSRAAWYSYGDKPYPPLPTRMARLLLPAEAGRPNGAAPVRNPFWSGGDNSGRLMCFTPKRSPTPGFADSLPLDYPSVWQLATFGGYDPLVEYAVEYRRLNHRVRSNPLEAARAFGVRWLVVHPKVLEAANRPKSGLNDREAIDAYELAEFRVLEPHAVQRLAAKTVSVWELSHPSPLSFPLDAPDTSLPVHFDGSGEQVQLPGYPANKVIVVSTLWRPEWKAFADGKPVLMKKDDWGRIVVTVPALSHHLKLQFSPPWPLGFICGLVLCAGAGCLIVILHRGEQRRRPV